MGIPLASSFDENAAVPLDSRTVVADDTALSAIPAGRRFDGLTVYVAADQANYQLRGGILDADFVMLPIDLVGAAANTASDAVALLPLDSAGITWDIPLSGTDATAHQWGWSIGGVDLISVSANGNGAGGLQDSGKTLQFNDLNIILFSDPTLATPFGDLLPPTVYAAWAEPSPDGAFIMFAATSADQNALAYFGAIGATTTTNPVFAWQGVKSDGGSGIASLSATEIHSQFQDASNAALLNIMGDGSIVGQGNSNQFAGRFAAGNDATIGLNSGFDKLFDLSGTIVDFSSSANWIGARSLITLAPTADLSTTSIYGHYSSLEVASGNTYNIGYLEGMRGGIYVQGSGNVVLPCAGLFGSAQWASSGSCSLVAGLDGEAIQNAGTITELDGVYAGIGVTGGTAVTANGFHIGSVEETGGIIGTLAGLRIDDQAFAGATAYSIITGLGAVQFGDHTSIGGASTNSVSILELISTTKGFMTPSMTTTQRNAITAVESLEVWDTTLHKKAQYNGTAWTLSNDTIQSGTATLTAGTVTISAPITASSRILVTVKDANPGAGGLTIGFEAPNASRNVGAGTFVVRANVAAGTINVLDTSTLDWAIVG